MYIRNSKFPAQNSRERGRILLARSVSDSIRNSRKKFETPFLSPSSTNDPKNRTRYTSAIGEQALFLEFHDFLNFSLIENLPEKRCKKSAIFWAHLRHLVSIKPSCPYPGVSVCHPWKREKWGRAGRWDGWLQPMARIH